MGLFEDAKEGLRAKRCANSAYIRQALNGISPKTADLMFDLSRGEKGTKLDNNRRAHVKAIELVSSLIGTFALPARPVLAYQGMVKDAVDQNGMIEDGVVRVGVTLNTLMGHRAHIDVPVIVRNKSLVEPAIFFFDNAPYVMCAPALEELVKRGALKKEMQARPMFSPPMNSLPSQKDLPRESITNHEHMFSPGARNPFNFRRQYSNDHSKDNTKDPKFNAWIDIDNSDKLRKGQTQFTCNSCDTAHSAEELQLGSTPPIPGAAYSKYNCKQCGQNEVGVTWTDQGPVAEQDQGSQFPTPTFTPPDVMRTSGQRKEPRKRTNIDTPTEFPELWDHDVQDEMLDPAERRRDKLHAIGTEVTLAEDVQARERGGGHVIIPKGEKGKVLKDMEGDGKMLYIFFPAMCLSGPVPKRMLKGANKRAATLEQVENEVGAMIREGYDKIDIKEAITRRYPQQAEEALAALNKTAVKTVPVAIAINYPEEMDSKEALGRIKAMISKEGNLTESEVGLARLTSDPSPDEGNTFFATAEIGLNANFVNDMSVGSYMESDDGQVSFSLEAPRP